MPFFNFCLQPQWKSTVPYGQILSFKSVCNTELQIIADIEDNSETFFLISL